MNYNVYMGILRALVPGAIGFLVGKGYLTQGAEANVVAAVITLGSAAWSVFTNYERKEEHPK